VDGLGDQAPPAPTIPPSPSGATPATTTRRSLRRGSFFLIEGSLRLGWSG